MADETKSGHCPHCVGSGMMGHISAIGVKTISPCKHCGGIGRRRIVVGSDDWKKSQQVSGIGLGKRERVRRRRR